MARDTHFLFSQEGKIMTGIKKNKAFVYMEQVLNILLYGKAQTKVLNC